MGCYKRSGQREPSQIADRLHQGQNESVMGAMNVEQHIPAGVDV